MSRRRSQAEVATPNIDKGLRYLQREAEGPGRRKVIKMMAGLVVGLMAADKYTAQWAAESYKSRGTSLEIVGGRDIKSDLFAVAFGGEGNYNDFWGAVSVFQDSDKKIPTGNMYYDNKNGLDFKSQARVLKQAQKQRGFKYLVINGDSEGGLIGARTALEAGIPVVGFIANSSPEKLSDAKGGAALTVDFITSSANPNIPLVRNGELAAKDLYCYFRDTPFWPQAVRGLIHEFATLPSQMASGGSPTLQASQSEFLKQTSFAQLAPMLFRRGIMSEAFTYPVFLEAAQDDVINPSSAYPNWRRDFLNQGIYMPLLQMEAGSWHADPFTEGRPLKAAGYFDNLIQQFDTVLTPNSRHLV